MHWRLDQISSEWLIKSCYWCLSITEQSPAFTGGKRKTVLRFFIWRCYHYILCCILNFSYFSSNKSVSDIFCENRSNIYPNYQNFTKFLLVMFRIYRVMYWSLLTEASHFSIFAFSPSAVEAFIVWIPWVITNCLLH